MTNKQPRTVQAHGVGSDVPPRPAHPASWPVVSPTLRGEVMGRQWPAPGAAMQRPLRRNRRRIGRLVVAALVGLALTTVPARPAAATYPGANGRIAYEIVGDDGPTHLWWANPDLSDAQQLTFGDYDTFDPAWSPDGRVLVYSTLQYATEPPGLPG